MGELRLQRHCLSFGKAVPVSAEAAPLEEEAPAAEEKPAEDTAAEEGAAEETAKENLATEEARAATDPAATEAKPEMAEAPAVDARTAEMAAPAGELYVAVTHLNVRSGPGMGFPVVDVITFQTPVAKVAMENGIWVKLGEGRYSSKIYLSETKPAEPMPVQVAEPAATEQPSLTEQAPAAEAEVQETAADEEMPMDENSAASAEEKAAVQPVSADGAEEGEEAAE